MNHFYLRIFVLSSILFVSSNCDDDFLFNVTCSKEIQDLVTSMISNFRNVRNLPLKNYTSAVLKLLLFPYPQIKIISKILHFLNTLRFGQMSGLKLYKIRWWRLSTGELETSMTKLCITNIQ